MTKKMSIFVTRDLNLLHLIGEKMFFLYFLDYSIADRVRGLVGLGSEREGRRQGRRVLPLDDGLRRHPRHHPRHLSKY
jgi:hypothetical protein